MPFFVVHGGPIRRYFPIQIPVPERCLLQLSSDGRTAAVRNKVPDRLIDEPTARTGLCRAVNGVNCGFGENDINTLIHACNL